MWRLFNPYSSITHCFHLGPLFAEDDGKGGGGGGGGGDDTDDEEDDQDDPNEKPTLTQSKANQLIGDARKKGGETAVKKLYKDLGVKDAEELTALIKAGKDASTTGKTEKEKLEAQLAEANTKSETAISEAKKRQDAITERLLRGKIKEIALKPVIDEKTKKVTRAAFSETALADVYDRIDRTLITIPDDDDLDGDFTGIEKALAKLAKEKPHYLDTANSQNYQARGNNVDPRQKLGPGNQQQQQTQEPRRKVRTL